jgi:hypothetical protein
MDDSEVPICDICFVSKLLMRHLLCSAHLCRDCLELSPNCPECFARNFDSQWAQLGQGCGKDVAGIGGKRKKFRKEEAVKNKKLKTIVDHLEELTQSVNESQKQESKLKLELALFEGYCVYQKMEMDKRQQMEMENLVNSHTLESQKLNHQQKLKIEKLQDNQMDVKKHILKTKSNIKCLNQQLLNCPECPICFDSFQPPKKIVQCVNGHALCLDCSQKPEVKNCPTCREGLTGRATAYEQLLGQMFGTEEGMEG